MNLLLKLIVIFVIAKVICDFIILKFGNYHNIGDSDKKENFYNIYPTTLIDPDYYNINEDPLDYYFDGNSYLRVGDAYGVDMKCGNVTMEDLFEWLKNSNPHILHQYVYLYDPSINIYNPRYAPRVFRELLKNLPEKHPILRILRKCLPRPVRIA